MVVVIIGINYPWLDYGWDFGLPPPLWTAGLDPSLFRAARRTQVAEDFARLAASGFNVVRWFVLGDGLATPANWAPKHLQPLLDDFTALLRICECAGLRLLPSLLDFHWCLPPVEASPGWMKGGRAAVIRNPSLRRQFLDLVLKPLLAASQAHPDAIYAWEPMNEPEWVTQRSAWRFWERAFPNRRTVPRAAMHAFLRQAVAQINAAGFVSTIGWAHWRTIRDWATEDWGIALQQFHYYGQGGAPLPQAASVCRGPCLVGEFAAAPDPPWPGGLRHRDDRLHRIEQAGYAGALTWSLHARDSLSRTGPAVPRPLSPAEPPGAEKQKLDEM